ncbi:MAG: GNAT family N-acyltransferase [Paracoccaceae bacterium]|jgi:putative hemolysin
MARRYTARFAQNDADIESAQTLRARSFQDGSGGLDSDRFDALCKHILVEECATGSLVCTYRLLPLRNGPEIDKSYSAQFYDLSGLYGIEGMVAEVGRFCVDPKFNDADILRVAWSILTSFVDQNEVELLFGCSSSSGTATAIYTDAFGLLKEHHLAPKSRLPKVKAPNVFRFASQLKQFKPDLKAAQKHLPPLLRTYLLMGGWVSDHAVVDADLNTLHVFTGLEIKGIPAARKKFLRATAA